METDSPPASRKPKDLPFYQTPEHIQTSAKIISEAKSSLQRAGLRSIVHSRRPVTPQEGQRKLFGEQSVRDPTNRPPSAFSLGSGHFESESRPVSGTRLTPLHHKPRSPSSESETVIAPKPPADPNRPVRRSASRTRLLQHSNSIDSSSSVPELSTVKNRSGSLQDVSAAGASSSSSTRDGQRRVHSGPKERVRNRSSERGVVDRNEVNPKSETRSKRRTLEGERAESGYTSDTREGSAGSQRSSSAGKSGSAGRREEESPEEALFYNTRIGPIVEEMTKHIKDKQPEKLIDLSEKLYNALEEGRMLGKACKRRSSILKTIFKLLDVESPQLLLRQARLILALKVSGNNLTNVCKLVFKVSREEKHDSIFLEKNILDLLMETVRITDPSLSSDALVYCCGALKFLTGNSSIMKHLVKHNCVDTMAKLLLSINKINLDAGKSSEQLGHILVQLTACLRNLADVGTTRSQFLANDVIRELCRIMDMYQTDGDLMLNVCRIFSKLTMHMDCCNKVASHMGHFKSFLHLLKIYQRREDLVVRVCFILGNLTAKSDLSRTRLYQQPKAIETLLSVFKHYSDLDIKGQNGNDSPEKIDGDLPNKTEDVLIKVVRVIANLSINEEIGPQIAANDTCVRLLVQILDCKDLKNSEELVLNTMSTINNLSYYTIKNSAILQRQLNIGEVLLKFLEVEHMEGVAEATRAFGNLSREKAVRDFLAQNKVDEWMVVMLDSGNREVVFTACGVLINLMADEEKRHVLREQSGISKLIEVLRDFGRSDWQLASMVCQILWNYSGKITSSNACFGQEEAQELTDLLYEYTDKDTVLDPSHNADFDEEMREFTQEMWEREFYPVAGQLLNRIEAHQSNFEPLEHPT